MPASTASAAEVYRRLRWKEPLTARDMEFLDIFMQRAIDLLNGDHETQPNMKFLREKFNDKATGWLRRAIDECPKVYREIKSDMALADAWFEGIWAVVEPELSVAVQNGDFKLVEEEHGPGCGCLVEEIWRRPRP